ncbi:hypothetical protein ACFYY5_29135 [Nocardia elegans]|uniref:Uncharacterized protein n=1 Tax=Nocardia elegans TaxID=300029 RepID=A0ABW6TLB3_9NOCA
MPDPKTVASLDEWTAYAEDTDEPIAHAVGELADQIRERFGVNKHVPVILREEVEYYHPSCDCCATEIDECLRIECGDQWATVPVYDGSPGHYYRNWLDEPRRRAEEEAAKQARKVQQAANDVAFTNAVVGHFMAATEAVEAEGYANDGEWHDQLMRHLGVKGYQK